jgi:hypothetical protein
MTNTVNYSRTGNSIPCRHKCRGGHECRCNGAGHTHHICRFENCQCHRPEAYGLERVELRNGAAVYVHIQRVQP